MKCKICGAESGKYPLCRDCNKKREKGEIIRCQKCGEWHVKEQPCAADSAAQEDSYLYQLRDSLISQTESAFFDAIRTSVPDGFFVFPQINLAAFIERTDHARYRNELFRNVDFLITDAAYAPKIVIEINDQTHLTAERRERDAKVQKICEEAGIPIIKLWTSYGVNTEYIQGKVRETLDTLPVKRIHHLHKNDAMPAAEASAAQPSDAKKKGCYIATCVYGSYDCPPVWTLRRYRDGVLSKTWYGRLFIRVYYAVSPILVKWFGNKGWFRTLCKNRLDMKVNNLQAAGYSDTPYSDL